MQVRGSICTSGSAERMKAEATISCESIGLVTE